MAVTFSTAAVKDSLCLWASCHWFWEFDPLLTAHPQGVPQFNLESSASSACHPHSPAHQTSSQNLSYDSCVYCMHAIRSWNCLHLELRGAPHSGYIMPTFSGQTLSRLGDIKFDDVYSNKWYLNIINAYSMPLKKPRSGICIFLDTSWCDLWLPNLPREFGGIWQTLASHIPLL